VCAADDSLESPDESVEAVTCKAVACCDLADGLHCVSECAAAGGVVEIEK